MADIDVRDLTETDWPIYRKLRLAALQESPGAFVGTYADESFNTILELGFATSIRKEWEWRKDRGESTRNLDAFRGWLERDEQSD